MIAQSKNTVNSIGKGVLVYGQKHTCAEWQSPHEWQYGCSGRAVYKGGRAGRAQGCPL